MCVDTGNPYDLQLFFVDLRQKGAQHLLTLR
jgi:hypothetical protein